MKKPFSVVKLKSALLKIEKEITKQQRQMLMTHYANRVASMERIARFGDYKSFHSANSQYGNLAGRIADQLGYRSRDHHRTYTIATLVSERDDEGRHQWRMDDEVAMALEQLEWVSPLELPIENETSLHLDQNVPETEREALTKARRGQGKFRNEVVALWGCCAVTACSLKKILIASHIVPWEDSTNKERLDPFNGLLLTPNLDRLFENWFISFEDDGTMLLSKDFTAEMRRLLGIREGDKLRFVKPESRAYLKRHRQIFLRKQLTSS